MEMTLMLRTDETLAGSMSNWFSLSRRGRVLKLLLWPTNLYYNAGQCVMSDFRFFFVFLLFSCVDLAITLSEISMNERI